MKTECPYCHRHYLIDNQYAGQSVQCENCKNNFTVYSYLTPLVPTCGKANLPKSRLTYCILAFFLGCFGIHNFYSGHIESGVVKFVLSILLFWSFIAPLVIAIWIVSEIFTVKSDSSKVPFVDNYSGLCVGMGAMLLCVLVIISSFIVVWSMVALGWWFVLCFLSAIASILLFSYAMAILYCRYADSINFRWIRFFSKKANP